jgi:hypothetical protein
MAVKSVCTVRDADLTCTVRITGGGIPPPPPQRRLRRKREVGVEKSVMIMVMRVVLGVLVEQAAARILAKQMIMITTQTSIVRMIKISL